MVEHQRYSSRRIRGPIFRQRPDWYRPILADLQLVRRLAKSHRLLQDLHFVASVDSAVSAVFAVLALGSWESALEESVPLAELDPWELDQVSLRVRPVQLEERPSTDLVALRVDQSQEGEAHLVLLARWGGRTSVLELDPRL